MIRATQSIGDGIEINNFVHGRSIALSAGCSLNPMVDTVISRVKDGELQGGVIFDNFTGESIGMHLAGFNERWMSRDHLWVTYDFAFRHCKVKSIFAQVVGSNHKALAFVSKTGFIEVARIPGVFPGDVECVVFRLKREEADRYLRIKPRYVGVVNGV